MLLAVLMVAAPTPDSRAQRRDGKSSRTDTRPVTALVLSGGGARGAAHVGVLAELERMRIPVDLVVGTSMGSIVGGLYASGYSPEELETRFLEMNWIDMFDDRPSRKNIPLRRKQDDADPLFDFEMGLRKGLQFQTALIMGQKLGFQLQSMTLHTAGLDSFDDLRIPYRAVATELQTGELVVLDRGSLGTAMRASMAVPSVFAPVEIGGRALVDGGLVRALPVDVARSLGAERIIAVDISSRVEDVSRLSMFSVAQQSLSIYGAGNVKEQRALLTGDDVLLAPELEGITSSSFEAEILQRAIEDGARTAREAAARLSAYAVPEAEYLEFLHRQRADVDSLARQLTIDGIAVEGNSRVSTRQVLSRLKSRTGEALNLETLQDDLARIYEIGEFQHATFRLDPGPNGTFWLVIELEEKPWGPNYVRFGLALESNFQGRGEFSALAQLTRTQLNARGGEWKSRISLGSEDQLFSEFYQPLDFPGYFFVAPAILYFESEVYALSPTDDLERVRLEFAAASIDVGIQFRNVGQLRFGVVRGTGKADVVTQSEYDRIDFEIGGLQSNLIIDRLDNVNFPRAGMAVQSNLLLSRESLGGDQNYKRLDLSAVGAYSRGKNTILLSLNGATNLGSDTPFYERVELGGFLNLSGLERGAATGSLGGVLTTAYYRQIGRMSPALGKGLYVGGSIETGGVWDHSNDVTASDLIWSGSLFVGADTKLGPLYLGYGRAESGDDAFYFFLGQLFTNH